MSTLASLIIKLGQKIRAENFMPIFQIGYISTILDYDLYYLLCNYIEGEGGLYKIKSNKNPTSLFITAIVKRNHIIK